MKDETKETPCDKRFACAFVPEFPHLESEALQVWVSCRFAFEWAPATSQTAAA
jgi:hypothetical protein